MPLGNSYSRREKCDKSSTNMEISHITMQHPRYLRKVNNRCQFSQKSTGSSLSTRVCGATGNYTQLFCKGKAFENVVCACVCVCVTLNHSAVQLKLTQNCKPTMLQLKIVHFFPQSIHGSIYQQLWRANIGMSVRSNGPHPSPSESGWYLWRWKSSQEDVIRLHHCLFSAENSLCLRIPRVENNHMAFIQ